MAHHPDKDAPTPEELGARVANNDVDALRQDSEKVTRKINEAYVKLASKLRGKADKAKASMETKKDGQKRTLLRRRFELYADAATDIEMRLADRQGTNSADSD